jgi:hypothetical protein
MGENFNLVRDEWKILVQQTMQQLLTSDTSRDMQLKGYPKQQQGGGRRALLPPNSKKLSIKSRSQMAHGIRDKRFRILKRLFSREKDGNVCSNSGPCPYTTVA